MSFDKISQIRRLIEAPKINLLSLDVFDTLLLRETTPEPVRFREIAKMQANALCSELEFNVSAGDVYLLRLEAARTAYATRRAIHGAREASWREIYEIIFHILKIPLEDQLLELCLSRELEYETKHLKLNTRLFKLIGDFSTTGKSVVFLSDMYLSGKDIKSLIDAVVGFQTNYKVISSADFGFGKASGVLFRELARNEKMEFDQIVHCGDNLNSDFKVPMSLGIQSVHTPRSRLFRFWHRTRQFLQN